MYGIHSTKRKETNVRRSAAPLPFFSPVVLTFLASVTTLYSGEQRCFVILPDYLFHRSRILLCNLACQGMDGSAPHSQEMMKMVWLDAPLELLLLLCWRKLLTKKDTFLMLPFFLFFSPGFPFLSSSSCVTVPFSKTLRAPVDVRYVKKKMKGNKVDFDLVSFWCCCCCSRLAFSPFLEKLTHKLTHDSHLNLSWAG